MHLTNKTFDEMEIGQTQELRRLVTADDLYVFANVSGNYNPMHLPEWDGDGDGHVESVAPGMYIASLISAVLGTSLPGPGTSYRKQSIEFLDRVYAGEEVICRVTVADKLDGGLVVLDTDIRRAIDDAIVLTGQATVAAPTQKFDRDDVDIPRLVVERHKHFDAILEKARPLPSIPTAVVCPEDEKSLGGAILAAEHSIITPILIGNRDKILAAAQGLGIDISRYELLDGDHHSAPALACKLVHEGRARAVMKGHLHTEDLLRPMVQRDTGLRIGKRFTHVFVMDVPGMPHPVMVTDAAINITPDLKTKVDIVQNAIDLSISIGHDAPLAAILSAVETVNPDIPSSIDAALLSKMAERGQITGGFVDGPLAMDNAVDIGAARTKGLTGKVAGHANILVVPNIDAGNMLAKQLAFISHAEGAGIVLGAKVPVILNSRSDSSKSRLASCAVAALHQARLSGGVL
ncbi:enoyl-CoA hydratase [Marivivens niveibacter]|uniref:Enoyl-CoA hydratase n=1 Tax=Marivivens niveibacter TaxID=1930667 RepID=A0A251X143_9RHOB|nr:bifunctional enoyl-CoA hydratase/phosphate acetyltransferase [Marivivens niveibacter]OUD10034.1 enoyl-CoA hydratase [Marivivens niveibacter]